MRAASHIDTLRFDAVERRSTLWLPAAQRSTSRHISTQHNASFIGRFVFNSAHRSTTPLYSALLNTPHRHSSHRFSSQRNVSFVDFASPARRISALRPAARCIPSLLASTPLAATQRNVHLSICPALCRSALRSAPLHPSRPLYATFHLSIFCPAPQRNALLLIASHPGSALLIPAHLNATRLLSTQPPLTTEA